MRLILIAWLALWTSGARAQGTAGATASTPVYRTQSALCIGVNVTKCKGLPPLNYAASDAQAFAKLLKERFGFNPTVLLNEQATRAGIEQAVRAALRVDAGGVALIYYSGHGTSVRSTLSSSGYLIPSDAELDFTSGAPGGNALEEQAINLRDLTRRMVDAEALHGLLILDCCFSGFAAMDRWSGSAEVPKGLPDYRIPSRQVLTAGSANQAAYEDAGLGQSIFTHELLSALSSAPAIPVIGLYSQVYARVQAETVSRKGARLTPQRERIALSDGEFWFVQDNNAVALAQASSAATSQASGAKGASPEQFEAAMIAADQAGEKAPDPQEQEKWKSELPGIEAAAAGGDSRSRATLAYLYGAGLGTERDPVAAKTYAQDSYQSRAPEGKLALLDSVTRKDSGEADPKDVAALKSEVDRNERLKEMQERRAAARQRALDSLAKSSPAGKTAVGYIELYQGFSDLYGRRQKKTLVDEFQKCEQYRNSVRNALQEHPPDWKKVTKELKSWSERLDKLQTRKADLIDPAAMDELARGLKEIIRDVNDASRMRIADVALDRLKASDDLMNKFMAQAIKQK